MVPTNNSSVVSGLSSYSTAEKPHQDLFVVLFSSTLITFLILFTFVGNLLAITTFYLCRELRTTTNTFLINISIGALLTGSLAMPIFLILKIDITYFNFPEGKSIFKIWQSLDILCGAASIWNLCLVSLDRCLAISAPLKHMVILTRRRVKLVILLVWVFSVALSTFIHLDWQYKAYPIATISFFLPLLIIIFSYARIFQVQRARSSCLALGRAGGAKMKREIRTAKQMALVIGLFIICWSSFFVSNLIYVTRKTYGTQVGNDVIKALTYLNSGINPILFTFISQKFKLAFRQILHCQKPNLRSFRNNTDTAFNGKQRSSLSLSFTGGIGRSSLHSPKAHRVRLLKDHIKEREILERETSL